MKRCSFMTLTEEHVGQEWILFFGKITYLPREIDEGSDGKLRISPWRPEDVGRRVYLLPDGSYQVEPDDDWARRRANPFITELIDSLDVVVLNEQEDDSWALGRPGKNLLALTPWFSSLAELEDYCKQNLQSLRQQVVQN